MLNSWWKKFILSLESNQNDQIKIYSYLFLFILAVALYGQHAWVPGFFHDGYLYATFGKNAALHGHWLVPHLTPVTYGHFSQHTPFVFILEGLFFKVFGASYLSARLFALIFLLLTLGLMIHWVEKEGGRIWAFLSGSLFLLIPPLIKKTRFPNMDTPMMLATLACFYYYWQAWKSGKDSYWIVSGVFFGIAMLCKGPFAFFIPVVIILHLFFSKRPRKLLALTPWAGLLLGIGIFAIWPLALYFHGDWFIFQEYLGSVFVQSLSEGRGVTDTTFFDYFVFLLKQTAPWFISALITVFLFFRSQRQNAFLSFWIILFLLFLFLVSLVKLKYSHYLIPVYPALAILAAYPLSLLQRRFLNFYAYAIKISAMGLTLLLLIFPLSVTSSRDQELFKTLDLLRLLPQKPNTWGLVDNAYSFFPATSLVAWEESKNLLLLNRQQFEEWITKGLESVISTERHVVTFDKDKTLWVFMVPRQLSIDLVIKYPLLFAQKLKKLILFKNKDFIILLDKNFHVTIITL
ncbi:MAG: glycosyltransferase family 39 protein, partial [Pseudomonadota bacterium]